MINCVEKTREENEQIRGYHMYMTGAKWDVGVDVDKLQTSFFPAPGYLAPYFDFPARNGVCGHYLTSTPGNDGYFNIFHLHVPAAIKIFEIPELTVRAVGCPVRCVREHE